MVACARGPHLVETKSPDLTTLRRFYDNYCPNRHHWDAGRDEAIARKETTMPATKTLCPISRDHFRKHAKELKVTLTGVPMTAEPKEFSTGSLGWNINGKVQLDVGGRLVLCQIGLNLTVVGSKGIQ
jgi:hypothetical protein